MNRFIPFNEFAPDQSDFEVEGIIVAGGGFVPSAKGVRVAKSIESATSIGGANGSYTAGTGAASFRNDINEHWHVYGSASALYVLENNADPTPDAFTVATRSAGAYTSADDDFWEFVKWKDKILAAGSSATADVIQCMDISATAPGTFTNLGGGAPAAKCLSVVRDFVVAGNTTDSTDGRKKARVRWSAFQDETSWTVSAVTQADYQDIDALNPESGAVQAITSGEYGLVFCERDVYRMQYVGSPIVFQFDNILPGVGTFAPKSIVQVGDLTFFYSTDGFRVISPGGESKNIGTQKVDIWVRESMDVSKIRDFCGEQEFGTTRIHWSFFRGTLGAVGSTQQIVYDFALNKWAPFVSTATETPVRQLFRWTRESQPRLGVMQDTLSPRYVGDTDASAISLTTGTVRFGGNRAMLPTARVHGKQTGGGSESVSLNTFFSDHLHVLDIGASNEVRSTVTNGSRYHSLRVSGRSFYFILNNVDYDSLEGIELIDVTDDGFR